MPHRQTPNIDICDQIAHLPLFQALTPSQIAKMAEHTRKRILPKGEVLFHKGDVAQGLFVVVFGQIKLAFPSCNGNEKVVDIVGPRASFGEAVMFIDQPYPVFAQSIVDSLVLHVGKECVFSLLETDLSFARNMLAGLSMRNHALMQDVETYSLHSSTQRVIGYLLQHCPNGSHGRCDGSVSFALPISKQIIASRLNLTPETFSRILNELITARLIRVQGRQITIPDIKRLREHDL
ncbi:MAG: Crp/Fnr family transcriptional regulator [Rhodocyclaceae bacterium]|nr:Crp/Fnr family transcriptional regulator [Rhodocyclaceae bacterium]MDZ4214658.1 Crp/Fnr family transcriptional regulator [Rhodocyclaceae bacterium]